VRYFTFILLLATHFCSGQSAEDLTALRSIIKADAKPNYQVVKENRNDVEIFFSGLFLFYKSCFSSQDFNKCNFTPSCSEYGITAVKKKGVLKGFLMTFDRLHRCNGFNRKNYHRDPESNLLIDPA
jgi:uncharacterized protein